MDHSEILSHKMDGLLEINRSMLAEIKKQGEVTAVQLTHMGREIRELKERGNNIEARFTEFERRCELHRDTINDRIDDNKGTQPEIGRWALKGWGIVAAAALGALGMKIAERLL